MIKGQSNECSVAKDACKRICSAGAFVPLSEAEIEHLRRHHAILLCQYMMKKMSVVDEEEYKARAGLDHEESSDEQFNDVYVLSGTELDEGMIWLVDGIF